MNFFTSFLPVLHAHDFCWPSRSFCFFYFSIHAIIFIDWDSGGTQDMDMDIETVNTLLMHGWEHHF
jgi:hypothetical protein